VPLYPVGYFISWGTHGTRLTGGEITAARDGEQLRDALNAVAPRAR
jgi:hypothetical protein